MEECGISVEMLKQRIQEIYCEGQSDSYGQGTLPKISVLLPTYRRPDDLVRTLESLEKQSISLSDFEIIVVDDGSGDTTEEVLNQFAGRSLCRISYCILKENGGPARARNFGLAKCRAEVILIIGDDIEPDRVLVEKHLVSHQNSPEKYHALLGYVTFPVELKPNGFMKWLEQGGRKYFFNYKDLSPKATVGPLFFYTCNVSVKRELLLESGWFDESFPYASHEDLELGYRLTQAGMKLEYDPEAMGYHWHMLSVEGIARRVYLMGYSAVIFWQRVGESGNLPRKLLRDLIAGMASTKLAVTLWENLRNRQYKDDKEYPASWHLLLLLSFFLGLADCKKKKSIRL